MYRISNTNILFNTQNESDLKINSIKKLNMI